MLYTVFLALHIVGACVTGIVAALAGVVLWRRDTAQYRKYAVMLGFLGGFEVLCGITLSVVSAQISTVSLCGNIAIYLSVLFFLEAVLFMRMHRVSLVYPAKLALSPMMASLLLMVASISYGF